MDAQDEIVVATPELKFIDGKLRQRFAVTRVDVLTREGQSTMEWREVPSEVTEDAQ